MDKSRALAREGLSVAKDPGVRESLILLLARFELREGRLREALEILVKPADSNPARTAHFAELLDAAGDGERASKLYAVAEARGGRPHIQLARLHQRAGRYEEALYRYECDLKSGSLLPAWPSDEDLGPVPLRPGAASSSSEGRAQMLKALGR